MGAVVLPVCMNLVLWLIAQVSDGRYTLKLPAQEYVTFAIVGGILAVLGDLIESFLKRCSNQKDSGSMLASHGGILDRMDSFLLFLPCLYWYCVNYHGEHHRPNYDFDDVNLWAFLHF